MNSVIGTLYNRITFSQYSVLQQLIFLPPCFVKFDSICSVLLHSDETSTLHVLRMFPDIQEFPLLAAALCYTRSACLFAICRL